MKRLLLLGAALAFTCGTAMAEMPATPAEGDVPAAAAPAPTAPGDQDMRPGWQGWHRNHGRGRFMGHGDWADRVMPGLARGRHGMGMPPFAGERMPMVAPSKAAHFVFQGPGGARIDIKCAESDTTEACATAAGDLIGKILPALRPRGPGQAMPPAPAPAQ